MVDESGSLVGRRVLLVEDETFVAMLIEDMLEELGCRLVGIAQTLDEALRLTQVDDVDVAVLDVNVGGELITPVAQALHDRGVPFVFSTGYGRAGLQPDWGDRAVLAKPFDLEDLCRALGQALSKGGPSPKAD